MSQLSPDGQQLVQNLSAQHGLSTDAVTHMLIAVHNGAGSMAQFNHPEFGGAGQWMMGGMTMVSDLFNHSLKNCVNNLCSDIASQLSAHQLVMPSGSFQSQSQSGGSDHQQQTNGSMGGSNSLFKPDPEALWWPSELGNPSATGSQNGLKYAYFADRCRLAVKTGDQCWVYDTGNHQIGGFAQQQGGGGGITLTSQFGYVNLSTLPVIWRGQGPYINNPAPVEPPQPISQPAPQPTNQPAPPVNPPAAPSNQVAPVADAPAAGSSDVLDLLERLANLKERGLLSDDEFASKKSDLLHRL